MLVPTGPFCTNPEFYIDKKSFHEPVDLLIWEIAGFTNLNNEYEPELDTENTQNPIPIGDRSTGGPSFFSHHLFPLISYLF